MATATGTITLTLDTQQDYDARLAAAQADPCVTNIVEDEPNLTITYDVNATDA